MNDEPPPERIADAAPEVRSAGRFCRNAVFYQPHSSGDVTIRMPDLKLGYRKYINKLVSRETLGPNPSTARPRRDMRGPRGPHKP